MAYGKLRVDTLTYDNAGSDVDINVSTIPDAAALNAKVNTSDIGVTVQAYDADTSKYDDATANFTGTLQNGGSDVVVDSDIGVNVQGYDADTAKTDVAQTFTAAQRGSISPVTVASGDTSKTLDFATANNFELSLANTATCDIANPSNLTAGQSGSIFLVQDASGSRLLSWNSYWHWKDDTPPTLTTTANAVDRVDYVVRSATSIHAVATLNVY